MTDNEHLNLFYSYRILSNRLSRETANLYRTYAKSLCDFLSKKKKCLSDVTIKILIEFAETDEVQNLCAGSKATFWSCLNSFGDYLYSQGVWSVNYVQLLDRPRDNSIYLPKFLTVDEIEKLLSVINVDTLIGIRDYAIFELIYSCGLRCSELCHLLLINIHLEEHYLMVQGKGNKERIIPFNNRAKNWLVKYITFVRPYYVLNKKPPVCFVSVNGSMLDRKSIWKRLQIYKKLSGLDLTVHTLRHSFATHLLEGGADIVSISEMLGHEYVSTTMIYTHVLNSTLEETHHKHF